MKPQWRPRLDRDTGSFQIGTSQQLATRHTHIVGNEIQCRMWHINVRL